MKLLERENIPLKEVVTRHNLPLVEKELIKVKEQNKMLRKQVRNLTAEKDRYYENQTILKEALIKIGAITGAGI